MTNETEFPTPDAGGDGPESPRRGAEDAPLVARTLADDPDAFGELFDRWFDRVFDHAYRIVRDTDVAADVAREAFLDAWRDLGRLEDPYAFGAWLLRITRRAALAQQAREQRVRPADEPLLATVEFSPVRPEDTIATQDDPTSVVEDASYVALLWASVDALAERDREVLDLNLRHGMTPAEIGDVVGMSRSDADQLVFRVRQRLATAVGARMLWHGGTPLCAALRAELVADDVEAFDGDAVRVADQHANSCSECGERRRTTLTPEKMFATIPIMVVPALKARVAAAMTAAGAPMHGSHALDGEFPTDPGPGTSSAGGSGGGSGALPVPAAAGGDGPYRGRRRWLLVLAAVIALAVVAVLGINAMASGNKPAKAVSVVVSSTTSTTRKRVTTTTRSTSTTTSSTTTTTLKPVAPVTMPPTTPPTVPPVTTTTIPVTVTFELSPNQATTPYALTPGTQPVPTLSWSVTGVKGVHVYDDAHVFNSTKSSGSQVVCPNPGDTTQCDAPARAYGYALDAYNDANQLVLHRTLTLTITAP